MEEREKVSVNRASQAPCKPFLIGKTLSARHLWSTRRVDQFSIDTNIRGWGVDGDCEPYLVPLQALMLLA